MPTTNQPWAWQNPETPATPARTTSTTPSTPAPAPPAPAPKKPRAKAKPAPTPMPETEAVQQLQSNLAQKDGELQALQERVRVLAVFEQEARSLNDKTDRLEAELAEVAAERDANQKAADAATAELKSVLTAASGNEGRLAAAQKVADGLRDLLN